MTNDQERSDPMTNDRERSDPVTNDQCRMTNSRRTFLKQTAGLGIAAALLPLSGCESLAVDPVLDNLDFPFLTPNETFFTQFGADGALANWTGIQQIPRNEWRLTIDGDVSTPLSLEFADLDADASALQTVLATLRCILDNNAVPGLIGTATWTGVPLSRFLDRAGIDRQSAKRIRIYGADGFTNNLTLDKLYPESKTLNEPLLAFSMNGKPLRPEQGAPVRLLVPGHYGYKSIKWVDRIEVTENDAVFGTYQEVLGYADDGLVDISCKTTSILRGARISAGINRIAGFALSGLAGIERVRISIDDGPYQDARIVTLNEVLSGNEPIRSSIQLNQPDRFAYPYRGVWTLWELFWDATPGEHTIHVEAIDAAGNEQPLNDQDPSDGQNPALEFNVLVE